MTKPKVGVPRPVVSSLLTSRRAGADGFQVERPSAIPSKPGDPVRSSSWSLISFDVDGTIFRRPALREAAHALGLRDGIISGEIDPLTDKRLGLEKYRSRMSIPRSKCVHVGDGRNEVPVFRAVQYSIALNSRVALVNKAASHTMITDDLLDVYRHLRTAI